jgi:hypothetical protein
MKNILDHARALPSEQWVRDSQRTASGGRSHQLYGQYLDTGAVKRCSGGPSFPSARLGTSSTCNWRPTSVPVTVYDSDPS